MTESRIVGPGMEMPNLRGEHEREQWMAGKPSRQEVMSEVAANIAGLTKTLNEQLQRIGGGMTQAFDMIRLLGQQNETMVRMMDIAVPGYRRMFTQELAKTGKMVEFLDTIMAPGEHSQKPIRERIELVRGWNAQENVVKVMGEHWKLDEYIRENSTEFTEEEIEALNKEFEMVCVKVAEVPVITEEDVPNIAGLATVEETKGINRIKAIAPEGVSNAF